MWGTITSIIGTIGQFISKFFISRKSKRVKEWVEARQKRDALQKARRKKYAKMAQKIMDESKRIEAARKADPDKYPAAD